MEVSYQFNATFAHRRPYASIGTDVLVWGLPMHSYRYVLGRSMGSWGFNEVVQELKGCSNSTILGNTSMGRKKYYNSLKHILQQWRIWSMVCRGCSWGYQWVCCIHDSKGGRWRPVLLCKQMGVLQIFKMWRMCLKCQIGWISVCSYRSPCNCGQNMMYGNWHLYLIMYCREAITKILCSPIKTTLNLFEMSGIVKNSTWRNGLMKRLAFYLLIHWQVHCWLLPVIRVLHLKTEWSLHDASYFLHAYLGCRPCKHNVQGGCLRSSVISDHHLHSMFFCSAYSLDYWIFLGNQYALLQHYSAKSLRLRRKGGGCIKRRKQWARGKMMEWRVIWICVLIDWIFLSLIRHQ